MRDELLTKLVVLGLHYPSMRFGQLMAFACSMAGKTSPGLVEETSDEAAREAIVGHLCQRFGSVPGQIGPGLKTLTQERGALVDVLRDCGRRYPEKTTGQLFTRLAALAHVNVYDAEDEQLAEAGRESLEW
jgi:hypothetical protein